MLLGQIWRCCSVYPYKLCRTLLELLILRLAPLAETRDQVDQLVAAWGADYRRLA